MIYATYKTSLVNLFRKTSGVYYFLNEAVLTYCQFQKIPKNLLFQRNQYKIQKMYGAVVMFFKADFNCSSGCCLLAFSVVFVCQNCLL